MTSPQSEAPHQVTFRQAEPDDLATILRLLSDDPLGKYREAVAENEPVPAPYRAAFDTITADPRNQLFVAVVDGAVHGCLQLTFLPGLTYAGRERALIEGVRVSNAMRGKGFGKAIINHAVERAREHGCVMVQLTTDKRRTQAQVFYRSLGFVNSHEGMKLFLDDRGT